VGTLNSQGVKAAHVSYSYDGDGLRSDLGWDLGEVLPLALLDEGRSYITGPGGLVVEQITLEQVPLYYHQDQLGSTRAVTDQTGRVQVTYSYDPYGKATPSNTAIVNPFQFAGQYTDPISGLIYLRARYYDPATGSFLTRDPLVDQTHEPYAYAGSDPLNETDPTGLFHYTFNFDLGATDQSPNEVFSYWMQHFSEIFPIQGAPDQLHKGQNIHLSAYGEPFPVHVSDLTSHYFKFTVPDGGFLHPDWPGGWVSFNLSQTDDCHMHLRVHGYMPDWSFGGFVGKRAYRGFAHHVWGPLADNLRNYLGN